ncbi:Vesicular glutamate transporter 3 like protein [Argiope bruennichi]|uniref:Sialin n=1 Tax=Argiope bruennichi TaxID=94029 RepID=A0A8T0F785_ARGBR|nr:Vesicular glutamate transporter 3 like protein [Argiope bruennichi]
MDKFNENKRKFTIPGVRYLFAVNAFLGLCVAYALRVNISVAIVAMVNQTAEHKPSKDNTSDECFVSPREIFSNSTSEPIKDGEFLWSPEMQGVVLGAFYYGYVISQIPGGRLAELYSGKWVFGISTFLTSILTLLTPIAARKGVGYLIAVRAIEGLLQGVELPVMIYMVGQWAPDSEKGLLATIVRCGISIGAVASMPLTGYLCDSDLFGGWPSAFYIMGLIGCLWFVFWCLLVTDTPLTHPFISEKELKYITSNQRVDHRKEVPPLPWKRILTSVPFWAVFVTATCQDWSFFIIMNDLPTFFSTILHFSIEENGFFSALPHLTHTIVGLAVSALADFLIRRKIASTTVVRKVWNSVSEFGMALGLVGVCFAGCNVVTNKFLFISAIAISGFAHSGYVLSFLDMAPEYAGTLWGMASTISNLNGFIAPLVVGALTNEENTLRQWRIVFIMTASILAFAGVIFIIFSSSEKQDWADQEPSKPDKSDEMLTVPKTSSVNKYIPLN